MNGVLVLDKPQGPTSFDMVARVRRATRERRVGHAGTLDPMATGVLVVCLGEATKLVPYLMDADKEYRATLLLGESTDTDDAGEGARVISRAPPEALAALDEAAVREALAGLRGAIVQRPPRYSALKVGGERLYARARAAALANDDDGLEAELTAKAREVLVHELRVEEVALPEVRFFVRCGKGTYIRSLGRDAGERLGVGGHLTALRRLRVGRFTLEGATALLPDGGLGPPRLYSPAEALSHLPTVRLDADQAARVRQGQGWILNDIKKLIDQVEGGPGATQAAVLDEEGALAAVLVRAGPGSEGPGWTIGRGFCRTS